MKQHLGSRPAIVVGPSLGGAAALDLAIHHPELVRGLRRPQKPSACLLAWRPLWRHLALSLMPQSPAQKMSGSALGCQLQRWTGGSRRRDHRGCQLCSETPREAAFLAFAGVLLTHVLGLCTLPSGSWPGPRGCSRVRRGRWGDGVPPGLGGKSGGMEVNPTVPETLCLDPLLLNGSHQLRVRYAVKGGAPWGSASCPQPSWRMSCWDDLHRQEAQRSCARPKPHQLCGQP